MISGRKGGAKTAGPAVSLKKTGPVLN